MDVKVIGAGCPDCDKLKASTEAALKELGINKSNSFVTPKTSEKGKVPSVIGLSAKEAVSILENNGLLARLDGAGYVVRQSVPAGSEYTSGQLINLTLRH